MIFHSHANKLIFIRKVVHFASFWKWGFLELGIGLLTSVKYGTISKNLYSTEFRFLRVAGISDVRWDKLSLYLLQFEGICKIRGTRWKDSSIFRRKQWDVRGDSVSSHPSHKPDNRRMDQNEDLGGKRVYSLWRLVFSLVVSIIYWQA